MIDIKDELLFDFSINSSRVLVTDKLAVIDNVVRIIDLTDTAVVIQSGKASYTSLKGKDLMVTSLQNSRMICSGRIEIVEFFNSEIETT